MMHKGALVQIGRYKLLEDELSRFAAGTGLRAVGLCESARNDALSAAVLGPFKST